MFPIKIWNVWYFEEDKKNKHQQNRRNIRDKLTNDSENGIFALFGLYLYLKQPAQGYKPQSSLRPLSGLASY